MDFKVNNIVVTLHKTNIDFSVCTNRWEICCKGWETCREKKKKRKLNRYNYWIHTLVKEAKDIKPMLL